MMESPFPTQNPNCWKIMPVCYGINVAKPYNILYDGITGT